MAHNFHDINGWLLVGLEMHQGFHIFPPAPMKFLKLVLLHPFTLGDRQQPTVLFNGVPSVTHQHEPRFLWPHLGIIPDPLDALTPLHILFGSHKCWLPRGAVEICGEKATCCVIGGPMSLNADCWDIGRWPSSLILNPGTVQTTPTFADFAMGAVTLAIDLVLDLLFEGAAKIAGGLLLKLGGKVLKPLFKKGKDLVGKGLKAATRQMGNAGKALAKGARALKGKAASALRNARCRMGLEPVDLTSGRVMDSETDLSLPGVIPLIWERHYSSARALERTSLGRGGWAHSLDQWIEEDEAGITLRDEEGRDVYFPALRPGERAFHRSDRLTLTALADGGYTVYSHDTRRTRAFARGAGKRALLRTISDAWNNTVTVEYTGDRLHRVVDTAGREVRVKLTHGGRVARLEVWVDGALERWVDYAYSKMGELTRVTDALGHAHQYEYDPDHRMVKKTLKNGVSFYYEYDDETGRCRRSFGDGGLHAGELQIDPERRITWLTGNDEPRILYWDEDGLVIREETPDGILLKTREHDRDHYLLAEANGAGETTRYEYDARGNLVRKTDPAGNIDEWGYEDDLVVAHARRDGLTTRYRYTDRGALAEVTQPSGLSYRLDHDDRGRLRAVSVPEGVLEAFSFDERHNVVEETSGRSGRVQYTYDRLGRPVTRTDALGRSALITYDRLGRPLSVQHPDGTASRSSYDALGNVVEVVNPLGRVTRLEYAGTGVLTRIVQPDGGLWRCTHTAGERIREIVNPAGERYHFEYDTAGRVVREAMFDGRVLEYSYSDASRLSRIDYPDGSFRAFFYDALGMVIREESSDFPLELQRDRLGRLTGAVVQQGSELIITALTRDALGRVIAESQGGRTVHYGYDARGRRTHRALHDGEVTRYEHDLGGRLAKVTHRDHQILFERDALGREISRRDPTHRVSIRSEYDSMDRLIERRVEARPPGGSALSLIVQRFWQYDLLGRVKLVEDGRWGPTTYRYDELGNVVEATSRARRELFEYDTAGSIRQMLDSLEAPAAEEAEPWVVAPGNLLMSTGRTDYAYDKRGRRVQKRERAKGGQDRITAYTWDCRDRLLEVALPSGAVVRFTYDAFGRRVRKVVEQHDEQTSHQVDFIWDGDVLAADVDSRHGQRSYIHDPGTFVPLLQVERGEVFSYVNDHLGTPKELIDRRGQVVWSADHSLWGRVAGARADAVPQGAGDERPLERPPASPFRLLGQYADDETGLSYTRFRYFDAETGRWCTPDPLGLAGSRNIYGFDGSPTTTIDPLGLTCPTQRAKELADQLVEQKKIHFIKKIHSTIAVTQGGGRTVITTNDPQVYKALNESDGILREGEELVGPPPPAGAYNNHAEIHGIEDLQAGGATEGVTGTSNLGCYSCQDWMAENAPSFIHKNPKPR